MDPFRIASSSATNVVDYAKFFSRSHDAVIHVYNDAGNVIENAAQGRFQGVVGQFCSQGLAEVKLVYAKNTKWVLSGPHQLQKFGQ